MNPMIALEVVMVILSFGVFAVVQIIP